MLVFNPMIKAIYLTCERSKAYDLGVSMETISRSILKWIPDVQAPVFQPSQIAEVVSQFRRTTTVVQASTGHIGVGIGGNLENSSENDGYAVVASLPPLYPEWLGDRNFLETHNVRFPRKCQAFKF